MSFFTGRRQNETEEDADNTASHIGFDTVLSASTILDGTLKSEGNIRLDGHFTGKLDITGNVLIGESAEINADIEARNISVAGIVRGNIIGNKVQLLRTGRVWGDIKSSSLTTEDGAFIEGNVTMTMPAVPDMSEDEPQMLIDAPTDDDDATMPSSQDDPEPASDDDDNMPDEAESIN